MCVCEKWINGGLSIQNNTIQQLKYMYNYTIDISHSLFLFYGLLFCLESPLTGTFLSKHVP